MVNDAQTHTNRQKLHITQSDRRENEILHEICKPEDDILARQMLLKHAKHIENKMVH